MEKTIIYNSIEFTQIKDYEDYYISRCGKVYSNFSKRILKNILRKNKYVSINLRGKYNKLYSIHRLVAETFIPNPDNKLCVNHIDCNPSNNHISNLEWCSHKENMSHASKLNRMKPNSGSFKKNRTPHNIKKVNQYDLEGNFIKTWDSITLASNELKINHSQIVGCAQKKYKYKTAKGYIWKYI